MVCLFNQCEQYLINYVCITSGILFNVVNIKLATQVVPQCAIEDLRRTASKMAAAAVAARHAGMPLDSKYPPGSRHPPSSDSTSQSLIGYEELAKHASSSDLWVAIEGKVYNLTDFAHGHPGGIDVIQRVAGKDASAAFLEAGHSNKARGMMSKFLVAHLTPHGYDQKGDTPLLGIWDGDITKAYVFGKRYTGYDHPMLLLMVVSAISIYLLSSSLQEVFANEEMLETGLFGIVCSLLMPATVTTLTLLTVVAAFDVPFLDHLLGTSDTMSTNPLLSVLAYMFTTFTVWNACLLMLWLFCDAWLLSGSLLVDAGVSAAVTCYRIGCVASLAAEVALKVLTDPPHELHGMLSLSTGLLFAAVLIDAFCFAGEMELTRTAALSAAGVTCTGAAARAAYLRSIHYIAAATSRRDPDFKGPGTGSSHYLLTMSSVLLAAIVSFVITTYMQYTSITADQSQTNLSLTSAMGVTLSAIWTLGDRYWTAAGCLTGFGLLLLGSLLRESNAAFTSMTSSMGGILFLWIVGPSIGYAQYVAFLIVLLGLLCLSKETSATLEKKGTAAPRWLYTAKQHEYKLRRTVAMLIHIIVGTPLQRLLRVLSPEYEVP